MHNPESVLENETHNVLSFEIQTDDLISARCPDIVIVKKKPKKTKNNQTKKQEREPAELWTLPSFRLESKIERKRKER